MVAIQTRTDDLFRKLGLSTELLDDALDGSSLQSLRRLGAAFTDALAAPASKFDRTVVDARAEFAPAFANPRPTVARDALRATLTHTYPRDVAVSHPSANRLFAALLSGRRTHAIALSRLLHRDTTVRAAFERRVGGVVLVDRRTDGAVTVRPSSSSSSYALRAAGSPSATGPLWPQADVSGDRLYDLFMAMDRAILEQASSLGVLQSSGGKVPVPSGALGGKGGLGGMLLSSGGSVSGLSAATGGPQVPGVTEPEGEASSIDVGTLKLKRMIDMRDQMITAVKNIRDKWNQAVKAAIDNSRG